MLSSVTARWRCMWSNDWMYKSITSRLIFIKKYYTQAVYYKAMLQNINTIIVWKVRYF